MEVAHTEHSHVIGKGGGNIKKVMEVTSCHIHFPDSNRHNAAGEKSNQVTSRRCQVPFRRGEDTLLLIYKLVAGLHCRTHRRRGGLQKEDTSKWSTSNPG